VNFTVGLDFSSDKLTVLTSLAALGLLYDPHSETGTAAVVAAFDFSSGAGHINLTFSTTIQPP
jgi:hypothetical protein